MIRDGRNGMGTGFGLGNCEELGDLLSSYTPEVPHRLETLSRESIGPLVTTSHPTATLWHSQTLLSYDVVANALTSVCLPSP
jgi:hypothetical protein